MTCAGGYPRLPTRRRWPPKERRIVAVTTDPRFRAGGNKLGSSLRCSYGARGFRRDRNHCASAHQDGAPCPDATNCYCRGFGKDRYQSWG